MSRQGTEQRHGILVGIKRRRPSRHSTSYPAHAAHAPRPACVAVRIAPKVNPGPPREEALGKVDGRTEETSTDTGCRHSVEAEVEREVSEMPLRAVNIVAVAVAAHRVSTFHFEVAVVTATATATEAAAA